MPRDQSASKLLPVGYYIYKWFFDRALSSFWLCRRQSLIPGHRRGKWSLFIGSVIGACTSKPGLLEVCESKPAFRSLDYSKSVYRSLHFEAWIIRSLCIEAYISKPGLFEVCVSKPTFRSLDYSKLWIEACTSKPGLFEVCVSKRTFRSLDYSKSVYRSVHFEAWIIRSVYRSLHFEAWIIRSLWIEAWIIWSLYIGACISKPGLSEPFVIVVEIIQACRYRGLLNLYKGITEPSNITLYCNVIFNKVSS